MNAHTSPSAILWKDLLLELLAGRDLSSAQAEYAMADIMRGERSAVEIASFLVALRAKGESSEELAGLAQAMLNEAMPLPIEGAALDIVGTGGDGLDTVNISTMSSLTAAGSGITVVKHGNRGASTKSGAADVIEALGVNLALSPEQVALCARKVGITFAFAQVFHPSMRYAAPARRELGIPTAFNVLGPLTNPARVSANCIGAADARVGELLAQVLAKRPVHGFVVHGNDGRDKVTTSDTSLVWEFDRGSVVQHEIDPARFGIDLVPVEALAGSDARHNAQIVRDYLAGHDSPVRDAVLLNSAVGIAAATWADVAPERRPGFEERVANSLEVAKRSVDSGAAARVLDDWVHFSQGLARR